MFNPHRGGLPPLKNDRGTPQKPLKQSVKRRLWATAGLTLLLMLIWFGGISLGDSLRQPLIGYIIMGVYFAAFAGILIAYLIYNRAFVNKDVTVDMLPMDWSEERKFAFVEDIRRRAEKSRWMVTLIIPFVTVFLVDSFYLFIWDPYIAPLFV